MIEAALAQLRIASSLLFGLPLNPRSLDRLVEAILQTREEFGSLTPQAGEVAVGPALDEHSRNEIQLRQFRKQAVLAKKETAYYSDKFEKLGIDPSKITYESITSLPITFKEALRGREDSFIRRSVMPCYRMMTTGTTGKPASIWFSLREMQVFYALSAMGLLLNNLVDSDDIVQLSTSSRALLGNTCFMEGCIRCGAAVYQTGLVEPLTAIQQLVEKRVVAGKKSNTSILFTYPSYLDSLVGVGLEYGLKPSDFGLEKIALGGELVTTGVKKRAEELFGPVKFIEGYGNTEVWPISGQMCEKGHLHFEPSQGLVEVVGIERENTSLQKGPGCMVITPFLPFREATILLRYNTEDVVFPIQEPLSCTLQHLPAVSNLLGKFRHAVRHDHGWTFPREILEALESIDDLPHPARCNFQAVSGGVRLEVYAPVQTASLRNRIGERLESHGVPLCELVIQERPDLLQKYFPWRGDLREPAFKSERIFQSD